MKNLFALSLSLSTALSMLAQSEYCGVGTVWDAESQTCVGIDNLSETAADLNQDGIVGINDLLAVLSAFGDSDVDFDGVWDSVDLCTDNDACNFTLSPTEPCEYLDVIGVCGGVCSLDIDGDGICDPCNNLESVFFDGHSYELVAIGSQCWFAENLRSEHYANGDSIPSPLSADALTSTTSGAAFVFGQFGECSLSYGPDLNECDPDWLLSEYGYLYNGYGVNDQRGLCPNGWHVPTDGEWLILEMELGMSESEANGFGSRGTDQGAQMKSIEGWPIGGCGTNISGFSALPGGMYAAETEWFYFAGFGGSWWTSTMLGSQMIVRNVSWDSSGVGRQAFSMQGGFSIRCLKD